MTSNPPNIAIIGAGPAGLMAAEVLSNKGVNVIIFEGRPTPARKFLMAGRGGLNLTHSEPLHVFETRYGESSETLAPIIRNFPPGALIDWAQGLGQETFVGSSGRVFPKAMKASPLLRAWLARLTDLGVTFRFHHDWIGWQTQEPSPPPNTNTQTLVFKTQDGSQTTFDADAVILAMGGASWPRLGANGRWVPILETRNVAITPLTAFNARIHIPWSQAITENFHGSPLKRITAKVGDTKSAGEAVITRTGLEGGAIYRLNSAIKRAMEQSDSTNLTLDLRPDLSLEGLIARLEKPKGSQSTATFLRKSVQLSKPAIAILREPSLGKLPKDPAILAALIKALPLTITGIASVERAISTAGGIKEQQLDDNAMITNLPGVFAAGEMRDWNAPTGGYLLQATFATAVQAANGAHAWLSKQNSRKLSNEIT